ncbi:AP-3 complex subunit delta-1-like isoform X2 [Zophobas morio]|uniref:AP-3 complex subunit delta-1-like isoform X2 n=1 Tax=Zophobas morio TaxID=2755281 RepID=UPI0030838006
MLSELALTGVSNFVTLNLGKVLLDDLLALLSSSKASVRKKSVIALYKVCLQHPDALPLVLPRLREKCKDPDPTVQSSVISIFCELSQKNPKDFLCLAPIFYSMLKNSSTWMLIKIIKIFNRLMPLEPRLAKKLISPLTEIISTTPSLALLYETISAALHALSRRENLMQLCASKLSSFFERDDHNLRYLGLHALKKVMKINLELAIPQMDLILQCLESSDEVILFQSVDLLLGLLSKENFKKIIDRLCATVQTSDSTDFRDEVASRIISTCQRHHCSHMVDFSWYFDTLLLLVERCGPEQGERIIEELRHVVVRVPDVRPHAVRRMEHFLMSFPAEESIFVLFSLAVWICSAYPQLVENPVELFEHFMSSESSIVDLPSRVQAVYLQNTLKFFVSLRPSQSKSYTLSHRYLQHMQFFMDSFAPEVRERSNNIYQLMLLFLSKEDKENFIASLLHVFEETPKWNSEGQKPLQPPQPRGLSASPPAELVSSSDEQCIGSLLSDQQETFENEKAADAFDKEKICAQERRHNANFYLPCSPESTSAASLEKLTLEDLKIPATCAARKTDKNKKSKEAFKKG